MSRKIEVWRKRLKRQWPLLTLQAPVTAMILPLAELFTFIMTRNVFGSISDQYGRHNDRLIFTAVV
jgi:hypothetical protein